MPRRPPSIGPMLVAALCAYASLAGADGTPGRSNTPGPATRDPEQRPPAGERRWKSPPPPGGGAVVGGSGAMSPPEPPPPYTSPDSLRGVVVDTPRSYESFPVNRGHTSAPATDDVRMSPRDDPAYARWRGKARASSGADVWHLDMETAAAGARPPDVRTHGLADSAWVVRLVDALDAATVFDTAARRSPWGKQGLVLAVRFAARVGAPSLVLLPNESVAQLYDHDRPLGSLRFEDAGSLLELAKDVLPEDPDVRAARAPERSDSTGYVQVEELPEAVAKVPPVYPAIAREAGVDGTVLMQVLVDTDGTVRDVRVQKSIPMLDGAAVACVKQWRFRPARSEHRPERVWIAVPVTFTLH